MWQKSSPVDQHSDARYDRIAARISAARDLFRRQGAIVTTWRFRGPRKLGPYFRLAYRADGRQQSIYLGACSKLVENNAELNDAAVEPVLEEVMQTGRSDWQVPLAADVCYWASNAQRLYRLAGHDGLILIANRLSSETTRAQNRGCCAATSAIHGPCLPIRSRRA